MCIKLAGFAPQRTSRHVQFVFSCFRVQTCDHLGKQIIVSSSELSCLRVNLRVKDAFVNRPFARSGLKVGNKLHWDANYAVGLSKQRKVGLDWCEFLCFGSPTA